MNALAAYYARLAPRERQLVAVAAPLFAVMVLWFAVWRPVSGAYRELASRVEHQRESLALMRQAVATLQAAGPLPANEPLLSLADRTARAANFGAALQRLSQEDGGRVRARLAGVPFAALIAWLADVQRQSGARVESLVIEAGEQSGLVGATVTLAP